jgi:hypothetical protein
MAAARLGANVGLFVDTMAETTGTDPTGQIVTENTAMLQAKEPNQ